MGEFKEEPKQGPPAYMVSFGDMMTLILTFFILLVSMSEEQKVGLVAKGIGSFKMVLQTYGLNGILSESEKAAIFREIRVRFNLPPEEEPERREVHADASDLELIRSKALEALQPHDEIAQPSVATFDPGSDELPPDSAAYLDRLAATLRPLGSQVLILEGHAADAGPGHGGDDRLLAFSRADAVRRYLIEQHSFDARRVEARAWVSGLQDAGAASRRVDARLITPHPEKD